MIYLDNAATTCITKPVLDAMMPYLTDLYGNPSSIHELGKASKRAIQNAREQVANAINAEPHQIIFTSGATESNNWVGRNIQAMSPYEHPSIEKIPDIKYGFSGVGNISCLKMVEQCLLDSKMCTLSHIMVDNETGQLFNIKQMAKRAHDCGYLFHTDATQAFGHVPIDVKELDVDFLTLSGHKFHAPKGIGILYVKDISKIDKWNYGGGQENGYRSGTENVPAIVGIGKACELYNSTGDEVNREWELNDYMITFIENNILDFFFVSQYRFGNIVAPHILAVAFKGVFAGDLVELMSANGVCISAGSACSNNADHTTSNSIQLSDLPVDYYDSVIRISISTETTMDDVKEAMVILKKCVEQIRSINDKGE